MELRGITVNVRIFVDDVDEPHWKIRVIGVVAHILGLRLYPVTSTDHSPV